MNLESLIGKRFGQWTVIDLVKITKPGRYYSSYYSKCICDCGTESLVLTGNLKRNSSKCKACYFKQLIPEMTGKSFGDLSVIEISHSNKNNIYYVCRCVCGENRTVNGSDLRLGKVKRCATCKRNIHKFHGMKGTSTWCIWQSMIQRCNNPNSTPYKNYGGRGIKVCERWLKFENFLADMGVRPNKLQIDRVNNDGNYEPSNCRWTTAAENIKNRRRGGSSKV